MLRRTILVPLDFLLEVRKGEADTHEQVVSSKQKRVLEITKQVDALLLRYTSPANATGDLISDAEYKNAKNTLLNEKTALEGDLQAQGVAIEKWIELSERTFNLARYAAVWFFNGDLETKRAIFSCLGSNFLLKDRKLNIQLRKPFQLLFDNLDEIEKEMLQVRTPENGLYKGQNVSFNPDLVTVRKGWDSNPQGLAPAGFQDRFLTIRSTLPFPLKN